MNPAAAAAAAAAANLALPLLAWSTRDQLLLADLVVKYGSQNWVRNAQRCYRDGLGF